MKMKNGSDEGFLEVEKMQEGFGQTKTNWIKMKTEEVPKFLRRVPASLCEVR